jgi:hypothetical protein
MRSGDLYTVPMDDKIEPMSHGEAEDINAVEGYLLNDLSEGERLRFEAHYFECTICAEAIVMGQALIDGIRRPQPWWRRLAAWLGGRAG